MARKQGHGRRRPSAVRRGRVPALVLLAALAPPPAAAAAPLRVVVCANDATDRALLARIRGQTSDLSVTLVPVDDPAPPTALPDQIARGERLAEREHADAVIWFGHVACAPAVTGILVQLSQPARKAVLVRAIGALGCEEAGTSLSSAALEEAAMVVRTALRSLAEGGEIGVGVPDAAVTAAAPPPAPRRPALRLRAGWVLALGEGQAVDPGVEAAAALEARRWLGELRVSSTWASDWQDALSTVRLTRRSASLGLGGRLRLGERLVASALLHLGVEQFARTTEARADGVMAAGPGRTLSPLLAPELRLQVLLHRGWGLAAAIGAALDCAPAAPSFFYLRDGELRPRSSPRTLQPRLGLAIELLL